MNDAVSLNPVVQVREVFESLPDVVRVPIEMVAFGGEMPRADISRMRWMAAQLRDNAEALNEHAEEAEQVLAQQTSVGEFGDGVRGALDQQQDGSGKLSEQASALADQCDAAANEAEKHLCVMFVFAIDLAWRIVRMVAAGSAAGPAGQVAAAATVQKSLVKGRTRVELMRAALKQGYERIAAATAARMPAVGPAQFAVTAARSAAFTAGVDAGVQGLQVAAGYRDASPIGQDGTNPTGIDLTSIGVAGAAGAAGAAGGMLAARFAPTILPAMHNSRILTGLVHGTAGAVSGLGATALITGWPQHYQDILAPLLNGGFAGAVYARAGMRPQPAMTPESVTPPQIVDGSGSFVPPATGRTGSGQPSLANEVTQPSPAKQVSQEARQTWDSARAAWAPPSESAQAPGTMDAAATTGTTVPSEPGSPPSAEVSAPRAEAALPTGDPGISGTVQAPGGYEPAAVGRPETTEATVHSDTATPGARPDIAAVAGTTEPIAAAPRPETAPTGRIEATGTTGRPHPTGSDGRFDAPGASRSESTAPPEGARRDVSASRPLTAVPRVEAGGETAPPPRLTEPAAARAASPPADTPVPGTPHTPGSENGDRTVEHSTAPGEPVRRNTFESLDSAIKSGDRTEPSATPGDLTPPRSGEEGRTSERDGVAGGSDDAAAPGAGRAADSGDGHATAGEPAHRTSAADPTQTAESAAASASTSRDQAETVLADFHARSAEHIPEQQRLSNLSDEAVKAGLFHGNERDSLIAGMEIIRRQTTDDVPGGMVLRSTQLEGAFELAAGRPVQMLPGQGKTLMFMSHALNQAVHKGSVLLVTTADGLAHREVAEYRRVLEPYGIDVLRADQQTGFGQVTPGRPAIVVATGETVGHLCNAGHKPPRSVVIDEMDAIVDRGEKTFIRSDTGSESAPEATTREVFAAHDFLADALAQGQLSHEDFGLRRIAEEVDVTLPDGTLETGTEYWYDGQAALTPGGRDRVEALPGGKQWLQGMGLSRLETAAAAEFTTRNKTHYVIDKGKVVIIDQVEHGLQRNPKTSSETRWSAEEGKAGLAQAVEAKEIRNAEAIGMSAEQHQIVVRADSESTQSITAAEIYGTDRFFDQVTGASGTLTDLGGVLQTVYGLDTPHEVAPHTPSRLVEGTPDVHQNTRAKLNALAGYAHGMWSGGNGRFQEILCHRNDLVEKQVNALLQAGVPRDAIEAVDANRIAGWGTAWETQLQNVFDAAGEQGKILVINRQGQRGVDISVSDTVLANGGMHVWMTEVPEQSYIYDQAKNRTARNGQPGTAQALMSPQDTLIRDAMHLRGVREAVVYYERAATDHHANPTSETHNTLVEAGETLGSLVPGLQERAHHRTTADFLFRYAPITEPSALITAMTPWNPNEAELGGPDHPADRTTRLAGLLGVSPATLAAAAAAPEHSGSHTTDTHDHFGPTNTRTDELHTAATRDNDMRTAGNRAEESPDPLHELLQRTHLPAAAVETLQQQLDATAPGETVRHALSTDVQALDRLTPRRDRLATELGWDIATIEGAEGLRHLGTATTAAQHELAQALKAAAEPGPGSDRDPAPSFDGSIPASDITTARARDILGEAIVGDLAERTDNQRPGTDTDPAAVDPATQHALATDVVAAAAHYLATAALLDVVTEIHRRSPNSCVNNGVTAMRVLFPGNADRFSMPGGGIPLKGHDWDTVRSSFRNGSPRVSTSLDAAVESLRQQPGGAQVLVYKWKNTENQGSTDADNHLVLLVNDSTDRDRPNLVAVDLSASPNGNYDHDFGPKDLADRRALLNRAVPFDTWRSEQQPFIQKLPESERTFWTIDFDNAGNLAPHLDPRDVPSAETMDQRPEVGPELERDTEQALAPALADGDGTPERPELSGPATHTVGPPNSLQRAAPRGAGSRPHDDTDTGRTEADRADAQPLAHPGNEEFTTFGDRTPDIRYRRGPIREQLAHQGEDRIGTRPTPWERQDSSPDGVLSASGPDDPRESDRTEPGWRVLRLRDEVELARELYHRPEIRQAAVAMLDRLREVLVALHPGASSREIDRAFYAPENVAAGPMVPHSVPLAELRRDGNVRELMAAISNAILRSGELPEEYRSTTTLDDGIAALLNEPNWAEKAKKLRLDVAALRQVRETITGGDPDVVVGKRPLRDVRKTLRYPEEHHDIAEERTRSSQAELERDARQQLRRGLTVQDWELLGMPLSLRELAAIPGDLVALRKSRLELRGRELPRTQRGRVDTDAVESELAAQDETFRYALPLYQFDENGRRMWDETGNAVVTGVLTYHEVGVVDAETALGLDPSEYAVPLPFGPGAARVDIARDSDWFQKVAVEQRYPVLAGLSGTAGRFASRFKWLQPKGVSDAHFAGAILAFLSPQHHSLYEQVRGMQMSGLQLVDEAVFRSPDDAVGELYRAVFDLFGIPEPTGSARVAPFGHAIDPLAMVTDPGGLRTIEEPTTDNGGSGPSGSVGSRPWESGEQDAQGSVARDGAGQQRVPGPEEGESLHDWAARVGPLVGLAEVSTPLDDQYVRDWLTAHEGEISGWRRHIHHHPEESGNEYGTARYVFEVLREAGLDPELVLDGRGVICDFGPANGERVALRADMDALKLDVNGDEKVIHACGHDAHTAMVLAAGQVLASNPERLEALGTGVRLVFQPAEESAEGAREMVEAGLLDGVDRSFALHCDPRLEAGEFGVVVGPMNASADKLTIDFEGGPTEYSAIDAPADRIAVDFKGPGGHTAHPEEAVDLIRAMSWVMATLPTFLNEHIGADSTTETAFGKVDAGKKMNAIPDFGRVEGMIRRSGIKYLIVHNFLHQLLREAEEGFDGLTYTLDHEPDADSENPSGHTGRPDGTVDLIRAMSECARDLDDALTERFDTGTIVTVFGKALAGYDGNANHGAGTLTGTIRRAEVDKGEVEQFLNERLTELKQKFPGLRTQLRHDEIVPTVINDPESILLFLKAIASLAPQAAAAIQMSMGGDDFAHLLNHSPKHGAYVNVGIWSGEGDKYSLHQPPLGLDERALDERALFYGALALAGTVLAAGSVSTPSTSTDPGDLPGVGRQQGGGHIGTRPTPWESWRDDSPNERPPRPGEGAIGGRPAHPGYAGLNPTPLLNGPRPWLPHADEPADVSRSGTSDGGDSGGRGVGEAGSPWSPDTGKLLRRHVGKVPPTYAEFRLALRELHERHSGTTSWETLGVSPNNQPVEAFTIHARSENPINVLIAIDPHPMEQAGRAAALVLANLIVDDPRLHEHVSYHFVPSTDPDSAVLNKPWLATEGEVDLARYHVRYHRDDADHQTDWGFPGPDAEAPGQLRQSPDTEQLQPETRAVKKLIDRLPNLIFFSLHGQQGGDPYTLVATEGDRDRPEVGWLADLMQQIGHKFEQRPHGAEGMVEVAPGVHLWPPIGWDGGSTLYSSAHYARRRGAMFAGVLEPSEWQTSITVPSRVEAIRLLEERQKVFQETLKLLPTSRYRASLGSALREQLPPEDWDHLWNGIYGRGAAGMISSLGRQIKQLKNPDAPVSGIELLHLSGLRGAGQLLQGMYHLLATGGASNIPSIRADLEPGEARELEHTKLTHAFDILNENYFRWCEQSRVALKPQWRPLESSAGFLVEMILKTTHHLTYPPDTPNEPAPPPRNPPTPPTTKPDATLPVGESSGELIGARPWDRDAVETAPNLAEPARIGSRPSDDRDISAPGSAQGNVVVEALATARAIVEQIVVGMGPVPHPAFGDGLDLERLDSLLSESGSPAALNHICRSRGFIGYAERVDARHFDEVVAAGGRAYFAVGKAVADDDSPHRSAGPGRAVVDGSTVPRDIDNRALAWESRDAVESRTGGDPDRVIRVAVRPSDAVALPDIESLVAKQRSVQEAIAEMRHSLAGSAKTPVNEVQLRQLGYAQTVAGDLDSFAAALGYRGYTIDDPAGPGHRSLRVLDPGLVVQQSEIAGTSDRPARDSGNPRRYSAHPSTAGTVVSVPASADAPDIDGIAVSAEIHEWMAGFDRRPEAALVAAALAARTEGGEAGPSSLAELLLSELRRCWDRVAGIPPHARFDPETEYTVVLAPSNPDSDSGLFVKAVLDWYPQLREAMVVLSGGAPLVYSDGTRQPPKFPAPDEAAWLLVGAERAGLSRMGTGAVEVVLDRQARTSLQNALHLQAIAKFAQYIDIGSLLDINSFLRLLEHEEFIDVDALPTYLNVEQRQAIAPLLYEDSSLLVVSRLFEDSGRPVNAVVISTDQHAGRLMPLIGKQVPAVDKIAMVTPGSSLLAFLQGGLVTDPTKPPGPDFRIEAILLEVKGLVDYTRKGEILEQHLSADVAEAFNFMGAYYPQVFRHDQSKLLENTIEPNEVRQAGEEISAISDRELKERKAEMVEQLKRGINERTRQGATRLWQEHADQAYEMLRSGRHHWLSDFAEWAAQHFDWAPEGLRAATGLDWGRALNALDPDDRRLIGRMYRYYTEPGRVGAELTVQAESALHRLAHLVVSPNTVPVEAAQNSAGTGRIGSRPSDDRDIPAPGGPEDTAPVGPGAELPPDTGPSPSDHSPAFEDSEANSVSLSTGSGPRRSSAHLPPAQVAGRRAGYGDHPTGHIGGRPGAEVPRSPQEVKREAVEYRRPVDWDDLLGDNQLLLLGEERIHGGVRELLAQQASALRSAGITHFGIEAPPHPAFEALNAGQEVDLGHVRCGPGLNSYQHAVAAMARAGIKIVPFDVPNFGTRSGDPLRDVRESHMTGVITAAMRAEPGTRMAVLVGDLHIDRNYQNWTEDAGTLLPSMAGRLTDAGFSTKSVSVRHSVSRDQRINRETFVADLTGLRGLEKLPGPLIDAVINVRTGSGDLITPVGGKPGIPPAARAVRSGQPAPTRSVEPISRPMDPIRRVVPIGSPDSQQIRDAIVDEVFAVMSDWRAPDHAYSAAALTSALLSVHGSGNSVEFHAAESGETGRRHVRVSVAGPALSEFYFGIFRRWVEPWLRDYSHRYGIQDGPAGVSIWFEFDETGPDFHPDLLARMRRHTGADPDDHSGSRLLGTKDAPAAGRSVAAEPVTLRLFGPNGREIVLRPGESQTFGRAMLGRDIVAPRTVSRENGVIGMDSERRVWMEVLEGKSAVRRDGVRLEPGVRHYLEHGQMLRFGGNEANAVGVESGQGLIGSRPTTILQDAPVEYDPARSLPPFGNFSDKPIGARPSDRQPGESRTPWSLPSRVASKLAGADRPTETSLRSTGNGLIDSCPPSESRTGDEESSGPAPTPWTSAFSYSAAEQQGPAEAPPSRNDVLRR